MKIVQSILASILLSSAFLLTACVSGTFGDHKDIEMFPLRSATESEGKALKYCLNAAYRVQLTHKKETGHWYRKAGELPLESECEGFILEEVGRPHGFEIRAEIRQEESAVRWSINEEKVMEEHLDPSTGLDLEF